jgi:hypothetical protein
MAANDARANWSSRIGKLVETNLVCMEAQAKKAPTAQRQAGGRMGYTDGRPPRARVVVERSCVCMRLSACVRARVRVHSIMRCVDM